MPDQTTKAWAAKAKTGEVCAAKAQGGGLQKQNVHRAKHPLIMLVG